MAVEAVPIDWNCCHLSAAGVEAPEKEMEPGFERLTSDVGTQPVRQQVCFAEEGQGCWQQG